MSDETSTPEFNFNPITWINGMFPLYLAPEEKINTFISLIHEQGYSTFFLLANEEVNHTDKKQQFNKKLGKVTPISYSTYSPRIFKVIENVSGSAIVALDGLQNPLKMGCLSDSAMFHLPAIPYEMVRKLDSFFRTVFTKHGTEAIVVFTYDNAYAETDDPSDGWGFLVPKQENTAASCDYDQSSIMEQLPDDCDTIYQVGTAHSHPHMSAYCSGIDKADQAEFDGLHITFGWQPGMQTDFHIELQIAGKSFSLKPEQVFKDHKPDTFEDMNALISNVSKYKVAPKNNLVSSAYSSYSGWGDDGISSYPQPLPYQEAVAKADSRLPPGTPPLRNIVAIVDLPYEINDIELCPMCDEKWSSSFNASYRCYKCLCYFMPKGINTVEDLVAFRNKSSYGSFEINVNDPARKPSKEIWVIEEPYYKSLEDAYSWCYYEKPDVDSELSGSSTKNEQHPTPRDPSGLKDCTCGMPIAISEPFCSYCHTRNWMYDDSYPDDYSF